MVMSREHQQMPIPLRPQFSRTIQSTIAAVSGQIRLFFYTPPDYGQTGNTKRFSCIINAHGGGFCVGETKCLYALFDAWTLIILRYQLGSATEDARWATAVVQHTDSLVCSVEYRLAPKHPFPTGVEDCADAILYIWDHADELGIDKEKIGISGFSAGGNITFSATMRVRDVLLRRGAEASVVPALPKNGYRIIKIIVAWYPSTDYTNTRVDRSRTNPRQDKEMPPFLYRLFDASYLYPLQNIKLNSPYLSPGVASDELLEFLPDDIAIFTAGWDGLMAEGERFRTRLEGIGKNVSGRVVKDVRHGWDHFSQNRVLAMDAYEVACLDINRVFNGVHS
ncbi:hypothetical protein FRB94_003438 [Tulasnella sp. JGI-2019a]|nr:hypothetical protein FRB93_005302 [Tulasnella sp. JGI-2019a]KAG9002967.1 hypothetical protein FRB94_003438 [Tulasnella sp. JGI-2019a]